MFFSFICYEKCLKEIGKCPLSLCICVLICLLYDSVDPRKNGNIYPIIVLEFRVVVALIIRLIYTWSPEGNSLSTE